MSVSPPAARASCDPSHNHHARRASRATTTTSTKRSVRAKPSRSSRGTASLAEAHCPCCYSVFILLYRISLPINQKRCQKRLPRMWCQSPLSTRKPGASGDTFVGPFQAFPGAAQNNIKIRPRCMLLYLIKRGVRHCNSTVRYVNIFDYRKKT